MNERVTLQFVVNGVQVATVADPVTSLQSLLRETLGLAGSKAGCREGSCGSCSVLVDGQLELSCLVPAAEIEGRTVRTAEGFTTPGEHGLDPVQSSFVDQFALQCGFCSPGMVVATHALLADCPDPTREEIIVGLSGNVCRCTGYEPILRAVADAALKLAHKTGSIDPAQDGRAPRSPVEER